MKYICICSLVSSEWIVNPMRNTGNHNTMAFLELYAMEYNHKDFIEVILKL